MWPRPISLGGSPRSAYCGFSEPRGKTRPTDGNSGIEQGLRCLFLENRPLTVTYIKHLLAHELAGHVARCVAGERSLLGLLGIHTKNSLETEEGLATYYEIREKK